MLENVLTGRLRMRRRTFIKNAALLGAAGMIRPVAAKPSGAGTSGDYFGVHPFVEEHPEAVFIMKTNVDITTNSRAKKDTGQAFARSVFLPMENGVPFTHMIPIKPNLTASMWDNQGFPLEFGQGIVTDPYFVEGIIEGMKELGLSAGQFYIREVNGPECFGPRGYTAMVERTGVHMKPMDKDVSEMPSEDIRWADVPDGVIHQKLPYLWPINARDTFYLNIPKFKTHFVGLTLACKNHQGAVANKYQRFCHGNLAFEGYRYDHLVANAQKTCQGLFERHVRQGIPYWEQGWKRGDFTNQMEIWCQRTLDNVSATPMGLCIVEGIYGREGCFHAGPNPPRHNDRGMNEARDYMTNIILFGKNPVLVDIVGHWLGGHEPGNFGFFHIALERGVSTVADPRTIPVYLFECGAARRIPLEQLERYPLMSDYIPKKGVPERKGNQIYGIAYDIYDELFDYSRLDERPYRVPTQPGSRVFDRCHPNPRNLSILIEYTMPKADYAMIEISDDRGERVAVPVNGLCHEGPNCAVWYMENLRPGTYQYTFRWREFEETKPVVIKSL